MGWASLTGRPRRSSLHVIRQPAVRRLEEQGELPPPVDPREVGRHRHQRQPRAPRGRDVAQPRQRLVLPLGHGLLRRVDLVPDLEEPAVRRLEGEPRPVGADAAVRARRYLLLHDAVHVRGLVDVAGQGQAEQALLGARVEELGLGLRREACLVRLRTPMGNGNKKRHYGGWSGYERSARDSPRGGRI